MNEDRKIQEEPAKRPPMEFPKEPHKDVPNEMPDIDEKEVPGRYSVNNRGCKHVYSLYY